MNVLNDDAMTRGVPILIFANKQDLPNAVKPAKIVEALGIQSLRNHKWHVQVKLKFLKVILRAVTQSGPQGSLDHVKIQSCCPYTVVGTYRGKYFSKNYRIPPIGCDTFPTLTQ